MSNRKKEQEEERKREERRYFMKWIGACIAVAAVDGVLESKQVGLVSTIWKWIAERKDLYSRTTNELKKLGFSVDEANSVYFEESKNVIIYLPDWLETETLIENYVRKLERIIRSRIELNGIGLEGILDTESTEEIQKHLTTLKSVENSTEKDRFINERDSANQEITRLIRYFKERDAPGTEILHKKITGIYTRIFEGLGFMMQRDINIMSLAPGLVYPLKLPRLLEKDSIVFGIEQEKDYSDILERGAILDYLQSREAIQHWLDDLDEIVTQIRENGQDTASQEEGIAIIADIRERMIRYNAEFGTRIEELSSKYQIPKENLQNSVVYDNMYFNYLVVQRSKNWIRTVQEKACKKTGQVYLMIGGFVHIPSVKDAAEHAKASLITIDYTK